MIRSDSISPFQLFSITVFSLIFGLRLYPSTIDHDIKSEWFISLMISIIFVFIILLMSFKIFSNYEGKSFAEIVSELIGTVPAKILCIPISLYLILQASQIIILEGNNIQLFLFDKTPLIVIAITIIITSFVLSFSGLRPLLRLIELLSIPTIILIIITLLLCLSSSDFGEAKAFFQPSPSGILPQIKRTLSCFLGIEITAFFISGTKPHKSAKKAMIIGYLICSVIMITLILCLAGVFTISAGADLTYPFTELSRSIQLKHLRVVERFDAITTTASIISTCFFTTLACCCSSSALAFVLKPLKTVSFLPVYLILLLFVFLEINEHFFDAVSEILFWSEIAFLSLIIPSLFLISVIKKKGKKDEAN